MLVKDSVIWVTGGTSGIGKGCTEYFVKQGAKVIFCGRNAEKGKAIEAELGENALFVKADMMKHEDIVGAAEAAVKKWGRIDVLCNFAGASRGAYSCFDEKAMENFSFEVQNLLIATFDATCVAAQYMAKNEPNALGERGCIINTGSIASVHTAPRFNYGYKAAKEGVRGLTRVFAPELAEHGIRINTVLPGYIRSGITEPFEGPGFSFDAIPETLFPRYIGEPEHIAKACQFMIEDPLMNKTDISVDGGLTCRY